MNQCDVQSLADTVGMTSMAIVAAGCAVGVLIAVAIMTVVMGRHLFRCMRTGKPFFD